MKIYYLEIVSDDVEAICKTYQAAHNISFQGPVAALGNAFTADLEDGSLVGIRAPLSDTEKPVVRPYWLVSNIEQSLAQAEASGAKVIHPAMNIPEMGTFAIFEQDGNHHGLWELAD